MTTRTNADVVVIGGGILGASIAWHLARVGITDTVVVERNEVASGATAYTAGLVSLARTNRDGLTMVRCTLHAIAELEASLGHSVGFHRTGTLRVAETEETSEGIESMARLLSSTGIESRIINGESAREMVPWLDPAATHSIIHIAEDGYVDGHMLTSAYMRAARNAGATLRTRTSALSAVRSGERIVGVETTRGRIGCKWLVDAAGTWAGDVLRWFGVELGATPLRSHYWISAPVEARWRDIPVVFLPDARAYLRREGAGLLVGIQEPVSRAFDARRLPPDMSELALTDEEDWELLANHAPRIRRCFPGFDVLRYAHHIAGLTTYTPDGELLLGTFPGAEGLLLAGGCCGKGVSVSGGVGRIVADRILGHPALVDLDRLRPDRFGTDDPHSAAFVARCVDARANKGRRA